MTTPSSPIDSPAAFALRLGQNAPVFAQRTEGSDPSRHNGVLIGNLKDQFLVIGGFATVSFRVGEQIVLRMIFGNHLVGFPTQVVKVIDDPQLYFVKFPLQVESLNLRKAQRIQAFFPAEVQVSKQAGGTADMYLLKTRVLDISAGGCSFRSKTKLVNESEVRIAFLLPGDRHIQSVAATIIDCTPSSGIFHNRVKFKQDLANLPALQEIAKWVTDSLTFTG
jgi:hypothetical protein